MRKFRVDNQVARTWSVSDLGSFYTRHKPILVSHANRILRDSGKAEEVVQDALIKVILAAPELNGEEHAIAYMKKTIENLAIDLFRLEGKRPHLVAIDEVSVENEVELQISEDYSEIVGAAEDAAVIRQALSLLSPAERAALVMWEIEGRSAKEIARELGIKETSVRHTVSRARASMRKVLTEFIIDEKRGLTALDLLSSTYKRSVKVVKNSSRAALSLLLLVFAYLGFSNVTNTPKLQSIENSNVTNELKIIPAKGTGTLATKTDQVPTLYSVDKSSTKISANARASTLNFSGLDKNGLPIGFTITDATGSIGTLYFSGKDAILSETGMTIPSLAKTSNGAANIFLNQVVNQDFSGTSYEAIVSFGRKGNWVPLQTKVISTDIERLLSGNYMLTAVIQVKSEVETTIVIPATAEGRDLEVPPSRVVTRILLNSSKTQILAQAVQVIEKVVKP